MAIFQLKSFAAIAASMLNRMKATQTKLTDFNVGSIVRTMLESVAAELDQLYQQMFNGLQQAIPVSVYNSFNFPALTAISASGLVQVNITPQQTPVLIPAGTQFTYPGSSNVYVSAQDTTIPAGNSQVNVQVACSVTGAAGNITQGKSFTPSPSIQGFVSATNLAGFVNGLDTETPDQRLIRFNAYISTLQRGTVAAIEYGLSTAYLTDVAGNIIERVALQLVVEPYLVDPTKPIALVNAYVHNGVGGTSSALVEQATKVISGYVDSSGKKVPGWKAAGIPVTIGAATEAPLNVTATVWIAAGYQWATVQAAVLSAISEYLIGLTIGNNGSNPAGTDPVGTAQVASIVAAAMAVPGVTNFTMSAPAADVLSSTGTKIMPGTITLTQGT